VEASDVIADRLHSGAIRLFRRVRVEDAATGVTPAQLSALSVLVFGGPRTMSQLAAAEQVRLPTVSRLVSTLEGAGLATRSRSAADARSVVVEATPRGRALLQEGRRRRVERLARDVAALPEGERETLARAAAILARLGG
jgi:DNA-binding MarR family transcriptional regulator